MWVCPGRFKGSAHWYLVWLGHAEPRSSQEINSSLLPPHLNPRGYAWSDHLTCVSKRGGAIPLRKITSETGRGTATSSVKDLCICHRREVWAEKWLPEVLELEEAALLPLTVSTVFIGNLYSLKRLASWPFLPSSLPRIRPHSLSLLSGSAHPWESRAELARCTMPAAKH